MSTRVCKYLIPAMNQSTHNNRLLKINLIGWLIILGITIKFKKTMRALYFLLSSEQSEHTLKSLYQI